jgi:hypothetical protein
MTNALIQKAEKQERPRISSGQEETTSLDMSDGTQHPEGTSRLSTLVLPGWLRSDVEAERNGKSKREQAEINKRAIDSAVAFYRALGFRRIGASDCFGFSSYPKHKSHAVALIDDFDLPIESVDEAISDDDDDDDERNVQLVIGGQGLEEKRLERLKQRLPLHHATITLNDADCVEFYNAFTTKDGAEWKQVNPSHDTVLHVAACQLKPLSTKWLMDNDNTRCLTLARNLQGYTPLESLQKELETRRTLLVYGTMRIDISDKFCGFSPDATACLSLLLNNPTTSTPSSTQSLCIKYGCTCGECADGFMSPRMKLALLFQAEVTHDILDWEISDRPNWCEFHDDIITHVTPATQQRFRTNKSLRQGFTNVFTHIATCLQSDHVPNREHVLQAFENSDNEWPPVTRNYLEHGGTIEGKIDAVLMVLFDHAKDQDAKAGDGGFEEVMEAEVSQLKVCRNDHEFGFVALACGLSQRDY